MEKSEAKKLVRYVVDDTGNGRKLGEDPHAIVRDRSTGHRHGSRLVCFEGEKETIVVAYHSYLDAETSLQEAMENTADYLREIGVISHSVKVA